MNGIRLQTRHLRIKSSIVSPRNYSTASGPVDLAFELAQPDHAPPKEAGSVVVVHGLFGQKQNWRSLSKAMARTLNKNVYALDLRNHGTSPHNPKMDHKTLSGDILHFFQKHELSNVALIGHSLGGKVVSALALDPSLSPSTLSCLTIADVTPTRFPISSEFAQYTKLMQEIENKKVTSSKAAHEILAQNGIELPIQQFLLTNMTAASDGTRKFRIPLDILSSNLHEVGAFPYDSDGKTQWNGPTLLIQGTKSNYINEDKMKATRALFPNLQVEKLDTGHWVHAEKPKEFLDIVRRFIQANDKSSKSF